MNEIGNPVKDLNPEQLLAYAAELMCEYQKKTYSTGCLIYYHEELKIVHTYDVPAAAEILKTFPPDQLAYGLSLKDWNRLRETLAQLQHEVITCNLKSKLLTTRKQKNSLTG